jgi:hypothetical protein
MGRQIITEKDLQKTKSVSPKDTGPVTAATTGTEDTYLDRLLKYIPAEIITIYVFVEGIIRQYQTTEETQGIYWVVFFVFLLLTPLYLWRVLRVSKATQLIVAFLAFFVWVFAVGGPFTFLEWYKPIYGAILLPIFTFAVAILKPEN